MEILIIVVILIFLVAPIIESIRKWYANREYRELSQLTKKERELLNKVQNEIIEKVGKKSSPNHYGDSTSSLEKIACESEYDVLYRKHYQAINEFLVEGYKFRFLVELEEDKKKLQFYDEVQKLENIKSLSNSWNINPSSLSLEEKKIVVRYEEEILDLYQMYQKYVQIYEEIRKLFNAYPHAFVYLTVQHLSVYLLGVNMPIYEINEKGERILHGFGGFCPRKIRTIGALSYSQMISLLKYKYKFEETENYILQQIEYNKVWDYFKEQILNNKDREKYYKDFLCKNGITNCNLISSKQYCLEHIESLNKFIAFSKVRDFQLDLNLKKTDSGVFYVDTSHIEKDIRNALDVDTSYIRQDIRDKKQIFLRIVNAVSSWKLKIKGIPYYFFYHYYPTRFTDISNASRNVRGLIYDFKDGKRHGNVVNILSQKLRSTFNKEDFKHLCFVCIPASNVHDNNCRYRVFSDELCSTLGMSNGFEHIKITKEKTKSHLGGTDSAEYYIDGNFFKDKSVILFDDVVTRGHSMQEFKELLEAKGATIICALSIGRTYSDYYGDHREPHPWTNEY